MIEQIAISRGHEIVSVIDIDNQEDFNSDAFKSADVAIEFTAPHVAYSNYLKAWAAGVKVVSGSTGWLKEHGDDVRKACEEEGKTLFWASNFSVGVAIFSAVSKYLAKIMNGFPQYDVSMEEVHHIHKLDHPSGTAITLAEGVISQLDRKDGWTVGEVHNPEFPHLRFGSRLHHHHTRCSFPSRLRFGSRPGRRVHERSYRVAHHRRPVQILREPPITA